MNMNGNNYGYNYPPVMNPRSDYQISCSNQSLIAGNQKDNIEKLPLYVGQQNFYPVRPVFYPTFYNPQPVPVQQIQDQIQISPFVNNHNMSQNLYTILSNHQQGGYFPIFNNRAFYQPYHNIFVENPTSIDSTPPNDNTRCQSLQSPIDQTAITTSENICVFNSTPMPESNKQTYPTQNFYYSNANPNPPRIVQNSFQNPAEYVPCPNCKTMNIHKNGSQNTKVCHSCGYSANPVPAVKTEVEAKTKRKYNSHKKEGMVCSNCRTNVTTLWRRDHYGKFICNACGLYNRLHNGTRPPSMRKDVIQRRNRKKASKNQNFIIDQNIHSSADAIKESSKITNGYFVEQQKRNNIDINIKH